MRKIYLKLKEFGYGSFENFFSKLIEEKGSSVISKHELGQAEAASVKFSRLSDIAKNIIVKDLVERIKNGLVLEYDSSKDEGDYRSMAKSKIYTMLGMYLFEVVKENEKIEKIIQEKISEIMNKKIGYRN